MADSGQPFEVLAWDSEFFGQPIARVAGTALSLDELRTTVQLAGAAGVRCLYYLVDGAVMTASAAAQLAGFSLVDLRITLAGRCVSPRDRTTASGVRLAAPADLARLREIASQSHRDTRFYSDGHFPREKCDELYATWIERSLQDGLADAVLTSEHAGAPAGYVTCSKLADGSGSIGLMAVANEARGRRFGQRLMAGALDWFSERGVESVSVVTQGRNAAAQRLYQRFGFLTRDVKLWYHLWLEPSGP